MKYIEPQDMTHEELLAYASHQIKQMVGNVTDGTVEDLIMAHRALRIEVDNERDAQTAADALIALLLSRNSTRRRVMSKYNFTFLLHLFFNLLHFKL
jgi:hypothetical protein